MLSQTRSEDKWVCPSDRHLSLRAKLNSGWSVRASSNESLASTITQFETDCIKEVITRAEILDESEQKRIGAMINHLELMRGKSAGNGVSTCILCAEEFGKFVGVTPVVCQDCRKKVCSKCSVELPPLKSHPSQKTKQLSLCKICSEEREVWKRSGAWYRRALPRYILPESKSTPPRYAVALSVSSTGDVTMNGSFNQRRSISRRRCSSSEDSDCDDFPLSSSAKADGSSEGRGDGSTDPGAGGGEIDQSASTAMSGDDATHAGNDRPELREPSPDVANHSVSPAAESDEQGKLGFLSFSLLYDRDNVALHVTIENARNLKSTDMNGLSDPYVKLQLLPASKKSLKLRTRTKTKTLNPDFNEDFVIEGITDSEIENKKLRMQVLDEDKFRMDDFVGEVTVALHHLLANQTQAFSMPLTKKQPSISDDPAESRGRIYLSIRFDEHASLLYVIVLRCADLMPVARSNAIDPQVKVCLQPDDVTSSNVICERTERKKSTKTPSPEYNDAMKFKVVGGVSQLSRFRLDVSVWDKDALGREHLIGFVSLGGSGSSETRDYWRRSLQSPGESTELRLFLSPAESSKHLATLTASGKRKRTPRLTRKANF